MSRPRPDAGATAARLLRWYPAAWRDRYGDEFAELLVAEIDERPGVFRPGLIDVAATGALALALAAAVKARATAMRGLRLGRS
jgi:hypothetical protein